MFFDKIYCLSIEHDAQRREHITKEFQRVGITTYRFWDAYTPDSQEVIDFFNNGKVQSFPPCFRCGNVYCDCANNILTPPQVSNFLGFIAIFKDISRTCQDDELVAICEDDIIIYENRLKKANELLCKEYLESQLEYRPEEPFLLRLTSPFQSEDDEKRELTITRDKVVMSNPFFIVNKAAAKIFVDQFDRIGTTSDIFVHNEAGQKINNFSMDPPLCHDLSWNTGQFASTIRPKENHVKYLKKAGAEKEVIEAAEQKCKKSIARVNPSKILVLGHPRGATGYITEVFKSMDIEVEHEDIGNAGTASWMFAVEDNNPYFLPSYSLYANNRKDNYFEHLIHLVRDPFRSMASIAVENRKAPPSYQYRRKHILRLCDIDLDRYANKLEQAIVSYLYWHKIIHSQEPALTIRVERDLSRLLEFLSKNQLLDQDLQTSSLTERLESIKNDINSNKPYKGTVQKKSVFSLQEWEAIDDSFKQQLNEFCTQYHYPTLYSNNGRLEKKLAVKEGELKRVYGSRSFKIGKFILTPFRFLKKRKGAAGN